MVRILLVVFFVGLVVCAGATSAVVALGGPHHHSWGPNFSKHGFGWTRDDDDADAVNGKTISRDLAWNAGDSLTINVPADINYTQGPVAKITATGPEALINELEVQEDRIGFKENHHWSGHGNHGLTLTITAPSVHKFQLNGAAKLDIQNYAQDDLNLEVNGAAQVDAHGAAKNLELQLNGAGQGNLRHLVNENANIQINGAGDATLSTTGRADTEINGVGSVKFINKPTSMTTQKHGFGSVEVGVGDNDNDDDDDDDAAKATPPAAVSPPAPPAPVAPKAKVHAKAV